MYVDVSTLHNEFNLQTFYLHGIMYYQLFFMHDPALPDWSLGAIWCMFPLSAMVSWYGTSILVSLSICDNMPSTILLAPCLGLWIGMMVAPKIEYAILGTRGSKVLADLLWLLMGAYCVYSIFDKKRQKERK